MEKEITITDNFMFATVMKDESVCRPFLERMLEISIEKIVYLEREKDLRVDPYSKGIRLDVHVKDSTRVFCLEMQCLDRKDLPLRTRYYQSLQDISFLDKGNVYVDLPETYILFVCLFDMFGKGIPVYTFENSCVEDRGILLNDKCHKVFYNVKAWEKETNPERRSLLKYFHDKKAEDDLTRCMQEQVIHNLNLREWRKEHMTIEQEIKLQARYAYDDGKAEGLSQGAHEKAVETARSAIAMGLSVEQIVKLTGLSDEEIEKLKVTVQQ
ncbi:Rpn family recombination-promoting nuclease/putative transposase [Treponema sp.]|uniref:Rpn family recombination-promoting nuclease/putative transposase n=1 Tax=Treponema sp. TaxID=166 RepID=UPI00388EFA9F